MSATPHPDARRLAFTVRFGSYYAALFLILGIHLLYFPLWLDANGLSAQEIAAITGAPFFIRFVFTPLVAMLADRWAAHRGLIIAFSWLSLLLALALTQTGGFAAIFLIAVPFALAVSTIMPLTETLAVAGVRSAGLDYGRMRLWGSLAFMAVGLLAGALIDRFGPGAAIWLLVAAAGVTVASGHLIPRLVHGVLSVRRGPLGADATRLVTSTTFLLFLVAAGAAQGAHGMFYAFGSLHWREQGHSTVLVGALWAVGISAEVLLFAYSGAVVRRLGAVTLLVASCAASVVRWGVMSFDPPVALLFAIQALHGLTYGASHLGAIHFISRAVPETAGATAQALYLTVAAGIVMGAATLLAGALYDTYGGHAYAAMAALALAGLAASAALTGRWDGSLLWRADETSTQPQSAGSGG